MEAAAMNRLTLISSCPECKLEEARPAEVNVRLGGVWVDTACKCGRFLSEWQLKLRTQPISRYNILDLFPSKKPIIGVEVGTDTGINARELLLHRPNLFLWTVDPWVADRDFTEKGRGTALHFYDERVGEFVRAGRSKHVRLTSLRAAEWFSGRASHPEWGPRTPMSFDFIYIDADHSEKAVRQDLEAWWPLLLSGGLMAGHDFEAPSVHTPVIQFAKAHRLDLGIINEHGGPEDMGSTPGSGYDRWGGWAHPTWFWFKQ
jgi:hypothetical protein